jgi:hypothetical protein
MMKSPIELLKEELEERYGIDPENIRLSISIHRADKETAEQVIQDYTTEENSFLNSTRINELEEHTAYSRYELTQGLAVTVFVDKQKGESK